MRLLCCQTFATVVVTGATAIMGMESLLTISDASRDDAPLWRGGLAKQTSV